MADASSRLALLKALSLASLKAEHAQLDEEIRQEMATPLPDTLRLQALKRRKLRLKEVIQLVERQVPVRSEQQRKQRVPEAVYH